jgi:phenylacetate-CoA ligase
MWVIAELLRDSGIKVKSPRAIITSAETLYPEQRDLIESVFGAPIYDQYGAAEMCMFVGQCKSGRYHARPDYGVMEIWKDGRPAAPGETGEVLCTGFVNDAMPLIRYNIGDAASWSRDQQCDCGSSAPIVDQIVGRQDDAIVCPDGRRIGRLSPVLKGFPVREAQYVQRERGAVIVRIVKEQGYSDRDTDAIRVELRKRLGNDMEFAFEFVNSIPRGKGGKFRAVINELDKRAS